MIKIKIIYLKMKIKNKRKMSLFINFKCPKNNNYLIKILKKNQKLLLLKHKDNMMNFMITMLIYNQKLNK